MARVIGPTIKFAVDIYEHLELVKICVQFLRISSSNLKKILPPPTRDAPMSNTTIQSINRLPKNLSYVLATLAIKHDPTIPNQRTWTIITILSGITINKSSSTSLRSISFHRQRKQVGVSLEEMTEKLKSTSAVLPWKIKIGLALLSSVTDFSRRSDGTINRRLLGFFDATAKVTDQISNGIKVSDIKVDQERNLWFRLYVPTEVPADTKLPVVFFFHGGGFSFLSPDSKAYNAVCRRFVRKTPAIFVSVNYRLTPEHKFPAAYDDGFDTLKFMDGKIFEAFPENADLSRCFLAGDSAGGNLAHFVARRFAEAGAGEFNELKVIGLIAIQPFFGGEERTESEIRLKGAPLVSVERSDWHWKVFLPEGANRDHEAVNVFGPNSTDISGLDKFPATLVFIGGFDPLQDWQKRYYEGLKRAGKKVHLIEYPNAIHAFYIFPELPEASMLITEVIDFIHNNGDVKK